MSTSDLPRPGHVFPRTYSRQRVHRPRSTKWGVIDVPATQQTPGISDTATIGEAISIAVQLATIGDTGTAAEANSGSASMTVADTGRGVDAAIAAVLLAVADTAGGVELVAQILASVQVSDQWTASDAVAGATVTFLLADAGATLEALVVDGTEIVKEVLDAAAAADSISGVEATLSVVEVEGVSETVHGIEVSLALADAGAITDDVFAGIIQTVADSASASELVGPVEVALTIPEYGLTTDYLQGLIAALLVIDQAGGVDVSTKLDLETRIAEIRFTFKKRTINFSLN